MGCQQDLGTVTNYLTVTYTNDTTNGQAYPTEIDYTGNSNTGLTPYNSVQFTYVTRADIVPTYQAGSLQQTTVLLTHVKTYQGTNVVSDYQLTYNLAASGTQHNELATVKLCDNTGTTCLAPTNFTWQGTRDSVAFTATSSDPPASKLTPGEFDGVGTTSDYGFSSGICPGGAMFGDTAFTITADAPDGDIGCSETYTYADFNGDGLTDMMLHQTPTADSPEARWILLNNGTGSLYYAADFVHLNPILADFNGDGRTDQFWGSTAYYSAGDGAFPTGPTLSGLS